MREDAYQILIADDEPDLHVVTRLGLKGLRYRDRRVEFLSASSGAQAVELMRLNRDVAVILLDVVMESSSAGLDACREIREMLDNSMVRILLRTGQPGAAPERQTITEFDVDGYLPKAELTSDRLYAAVRTAIKGYQDLRDLDQHRRGVLAVHDCVVSMRAGEPFERSLERVLDTAMAICPCELALLRLETIERDGSPRRYELHLAPGADGVIARVRASEISERLSRHSEIIAADGCRLVEGGVVEPLRLPRELGYGWLFLDQAEPDELALRVLPMLAAQAEKALYGGVLAAMRNAADAPLFDTISL